MSYLPGSLTIVEAATTTAMVLSLNPAGIDQAVTLLATVTANVGSGVQPTGTVAFFDGTNLLGATALSPTGQAALTTTFGGGSHLITARYLGDGFYQPSTSTPAAHLSVTCTSTISGTHATLIAGPGTTCLYNATITGAISLPTAATLDVENSTVRGSIAGSGAAGIRICGSTVSSIVVNGATGFVLIGDPGIDNCAANTVGGTIVADNNNTRGLVIIDNKITNGVIAGNDSGAGPLPGQNAPIITGTQPPIVSTTLPMATSSWL